MTFAASLPAGSAEDSRQALDRLIAERGEDYAALSRLIGRNSAYIQQFIKRGTPRRLAERDRATLAAYFGVDEIVLGGQPARRTGEPSDAMQRVPRLDVGASAGPGAVTDHERAEAQFAFDSRWLRRLCGDPGRLAIIRVEGDSMVPTLNDGDDIMVDGSDDAARLRDGIYVLRRDGVLLVKRLACGFAGARLRVSIISDNPAYPAEQDVAVRDLVIVGRVVWVGRRVS